MKIVSKDVKIPKIENISSGYIEEMLKKQGINPLRWAIVKVTEKALIVSVSFEA